MGDANRKHWKVAVLCAASGAAWSISTPSLLDAHAYRNGDVGRDVLLQALVIGDIFSRHARNVDHRNLIHTP